MNTTQQEITENVIVLLKDFIKDWGLDDEIEPTTKFKDDLCFSSVDILHFFAVIDMNMQKKFPYEKLILTSEGYRSELSVSELTSFIFDNRNIGNAEPKPL